MKRLVSLLRQWLAGKPRLRRKIALIVYRFPILDMRIRDLLHADAHRRADPGVTADHLSEPARAVLARLRARLPKP